MDGQRQDRVDLKFAACLADLNGSRSYDIGELDHFIVEGGREEENLHGEVQLVEHVGDDLDVFGEGCVLQHFVSFINHHAHEVLVIECVSHDGFAQSSHTTDHHLCIPIKSNALGKTSGLNIGERADLGNHVMNLDYQLACVSEDENLRSGQILTDIGQSS